MNTITVSINKNSIIELITNIDMQNCVNTYDKMVFYYKKVFRNIVSTLFQYKFSQHFEHDRGETFIFNVI